MLPALERIPDACDYIAHGEYFVLHAPRQTGKTTSLADLARQLTAAGDYLALHFSCEAASSFAHDVGATEQALLGQIRAAAQIAHLPPEMMPPSPWPDAPPGTALGIGLAAWVAQCPRPLVLFFDEIDSLRDDALLNTLRQLRAGYTTNRAGFVHSIALCGLRDVRDYKAASGGDPTRLGSPSPFNIKVDSIRLGDFTRDEVIALYTQHTAETGQEFSPRALDLAYYYTQGQPWLVNALASEIIRRMRIESTITEEHIDRAKERMIVARATHLDSLVDKLTDPVVQRVIEPLIAGRYIDADPAFNDAVAYVRDLGLVARTKPLRVANPIYNEVIVRVLGSGIEENITSGPSQFRLPDGRLDFPRLLTEFAAFWKLNGEILAGDQRYHEVAPQLVLMAFLHRIVNGGGYIDREYGVGRGRIDLLIRQPWTDSDGRRAEQREAFELKVWRDKHKDPLGEGLAQLDGYLDRVDLPTGVLVIFDRREKAAPITERTRFSDATSPSGRTITLLRA
ncbi:ATP-binding protein [Nocardia flavorosea]|uniref:ATP-binding protein n=2 Tax=Nocardia flavorosea TaxID=53429 RepID=A0A846YHU3_9NOCA|nr:ATP-binding protein [Nocardia flavorosea]